MSHFFLLQLKLGIVVDDIDNDDNMELIIYNYNYAKKEMNLNLCALKDDKINIIDTLKFDDVKICIFNFIATLCI